MKVLKRSIVMFLIIVLISPMNSVVKVQANEETGAEEIQEERSSDTEGNTSAQTPSQEVQEQE